MKAIVSLRLIQHTAVTAEGSDKDAIAKAVVEKLQATYDKVEVVGVQELLPKVDMFHDICSQIVVVSGLPYETVESHLRELMEEQ